MDAVVWRGEVVLVRVFGREGLDLGISLAG